MTVPFVHSHIPERKIINVRSLCIESAYKIQKYRKERNREGYSLFCFVLLCFIKFFVCSLLTTVVCSCSWKKTNKIMVVSLIKTNCKNDNKRNDTLITFNLTCAHPFVLWLSSSFYIKWISIICLFKTWISNYCQLISRYY